MIIDSPPRREVQSERSVVPSEFEIRQLIEDEEDSFGSFIGVTQNPDYLEATFQSDSTMMRRMSDCTDF